jgi:hypothetical protein
VRTTIDVPESVLERLKLLAAESGRKLNDVVNDALLMLLQQRAQSPTAPRRLPTFGSSVHPGLLPGLDPNRYADLVEALDLETVRDIDPAAETEMSRRWVAERRVELDGDEGCGPDLGGAGAGRQE